MTSGELEAERSTRCAGTVWSNDARAFVDEALDALLVAEKRAEAAEAGFAAARKAQGAAEAERDAARAALVALVAQIRQAMHAGADRALTDQVADLYAAARR